MSVFFQIVAVTDPDNAAWARWLRDVMMSWPAQLVILLLFAGLAVLLALHARREWEGGLRNKYLVAGLVIGGVFFVAQFLLASGFVGRRELAGVAVRRGVDRAVRALAVRLRALHDEDAQRQGRRRVARAGRGARRGHPPGVTAGAERR